MGINKEFDENEDAHEALTRAAISRGISGDGTAPTSDDADNSRVLSYPEQSKSPVSILGMLRSKPCSVVIKGEDFGSASFSAGIASVEEDVVCLVFDPDVFTFIPAFGKQLQISINKGPFLWVEYIGARMRSQENGLYILFLHRCTTSEPEQE